MFDNLRELTGESADFEEPRESPFEIEFRDEGESRFLGMTAGQRLVIALMLLATVVVMGLACLMVTERIWIP